MTAAPPISIAAPEDGEPASRRASAVVSGIGLTTSSRSKISGHKAAGGTPWSRPTYCCEAARVVHRKRSLSPICECSVREAADVDDRAIALNF